MVPEKQSLARHRNLVQSRRLCNFQKVRRKRTRDLCAQTVSTTSGSDASNAVLTGSRPLTTEIPEVSQPAEYDKFKAQRNRASGDFPCEIQAASTLYHFRGFRESGTASQRHAVSSTFAVMPRRDARGPMYGSDSCPCLPQCGRGVGTTHGGNVVLTVRETGGDDLLFGDMRLGRISIYVCNALLAHCKPMRA
jgi:hypothetical protein